MGDVPAVERANRSYAKEYARFCRLYGLFLVDGFETWRAALAARGVPGPEIGTRVSAAADFVRRLGEPSTERESGGA